MDLMKKLPRNSQPISYPLLKMVYAEENAEFAEAMMGIAVVHYSASNVCTNLVALWEGVTATTEIIYFF